MLPQRDGYHGDALHPHILKSNCQYSYTLLSRPSPKRKPSPGCRSVTAGLSRATRQASSHWTLFWIRYLFQSQPSDRFRHAANPKNSLEMQQRIRKPETEQMWNVEANFLRGDFVRATCSGSEMKLIHTTQILPEETELGFISTHDIWTPKKYKTVGNPQHVKTAA